MSTSIFQAAEPDSLSEATAEFLQANPHKSTSDIIATMRRWADGHEEYFAALELTRAQRLDGVAVVAGFSGWPEASHIAATILAAGKPLDLLEFPQPLPSSSQALYDIDIDSALIRRVCHSATNVAQRVCEVFGVDKGSALAYVFELGGVPWLRHLLPCLDDIPVNSSDSPLYTFHRNEGPRVFGEFQRTSDCLVHERNLRIKLEAMRLGAYSRRAMISITASMVVNEPGFLFGRFWLARLLFEGGLYQLAGELYERAYREARRLMPPGFRQYVTHDTAANNVYLEGLEWYVFYLSSVGKLDAAAELARTVMRYASDYTDCRIQYACACIDLLRPGQPKRFVGSFAGMDSTQATASLLRALQCLAKNDWNGAVAESAEALIERPSLRFAVRYGVSAPDPCLPEPWFQLLMTRRPDLRRLLLVMMRVLPLEREQLSETRNNPAALTVQLEEWASLGEQDRRPALSR